MAGIPGKGGRAGKSGRPSVLPGERLVPYAVSVSEDTKAKLQARGPDWVRTALAAALEG